MIEYLEVKVNIRKVKKRSRKATGERNSFQATINWSKK